MHVFIRSFVIVVAHSSSLFAALWEEVRHRCVALDHGSSVMPIHGSRLKTTATVDDIAGN
jgi:hypothetical protein